MQLLAVAAPCELHVAHLAVVIQTEPGAQLQFLRPGNHGFAWLTAAVADHFDVRGINAQHHDQVFGVQWQIAHVLVRQVVFQVGEPFGHFLDTLHGNSVGLGHKCISQGIADDLEVLILDRWRHAQHGHPRSQKMQQLRQVGDHPCPVVAVGLGTRSPDQIGCGLLQGNGVFMLGAIFHGCNSQYLGPYLEKKFADFFAHRHVIEQAAHLNGVLDRHGLFLLDLLGHGHNACRAPLFGEKPGEKFLEFVVHQLEHPPSGFGVLLNDLHNALDFNFQCATRHRCVEAQNT